MKPARRFLSPAALLLLLLVLSLGSWGWWAASSPPNRPRWLAAWLSPSSSQTATLAENNAASPQSHGLPTNPLTDRSRAAPDLRPYDPQALPKGLTSIDGQGGTGLNRAVKKNGVWFPVYSPGPHPGSGPPPLTAIPLSIASSNPPPGKVDQPFFYQAEAIGGTPPYSWSTNLPTEPGPFLFHPPDATLRGTTSLPRLSPFQLTVTDAAGATDSAALTLIIKPAQDLAITTPDPLDPLSVDRPFTLSFQASGGLPPYSWNSNPGAPGGLPIDSSGLCSGSPLEAGEYPFTLTLIDAQLTKVQHDFVLTVTESVSITTPNSLPPAAPGEPYRGTFAAAGGTPPYTWELDSGQLPGPSWELSPDGILTGRGGADTPWAKFTLAVTDAAGASFRKPFQLAISDLLILVPSREKVGVAWHPARVSQWLAAAGLNAHSFRVLRDGQTVYQGTGSNFVDHNLPTGSTPRYTLIALTSDGTEQALAEQQTAVLPQTLARAQPGSTGDPYADRVVSFRPLSAGGYGSSSLPRNVTGPPDGRSTYAPAYKPTEVLSLHAKPFAGGFIDLEFTDNIIEIAPGEDLTIFENVLFIGGSANQRFMEPAVISVALFPGEWRALPCDAVPPAPGQPLDLRDPFYYARGFAGRNGTTGDDPTNPTRSGGDSLDLDPAATGLTWIRYLRIQSTGDQARFDDVGGDLIRHPDDPAFNPLSGTGSSGFDLDAVSAVHY